MLDLFFDIDPMTDGTIMTAVFAISGAAFSFAATFDISARKKAVCGRCSAYCAVYSAIVATGTFFASRYYLN